MSYEIISAGSGAWRIQEENVRSFLFCGKERALLVDTGCNITNMREIVSGLTELPVIVVNTHSDFDHIRCNSQFDTVLMHPAEFPVYYKAKNQTSPVQPVWEGERLDLGGRVFEVVYTPGHTPGSITLLDREARILVGGDGIQDWMIFMFGPFRDLHAYCASLEKLWAMGPLFDQVWPSHGSPTVSQEVIPDLLNGARAILAGTCPGCTYEYDGTPLIQYDLQAATMLVERGLFTQKA